MNSIRNANRRAVGALGAALAALAIAGCGGSDAEARPTTDSDAKAEFIAAADALCAESGAATDAAVQKRIASLDSESLSQEQVTAIITEIIAAGGRGALRAHRLSSSRPR